MIYDKIGNKNDVFVGDGRLKLEGRLSGNHVRIKQIPDLGHKIVCAMTHSVGLQQPVHTHIPQ
jgi:hypothetical protein